MSSGGKRLGAGRPKGSPNKATAVREKEIAASGLTPLNYMLGVLRGEIEPDPGKVWAAKNAAPYCHPRLSHQQGGQGGVTVNVTLVRFSITGPGDNAGLHLAKPVAAPALPATPLALP